MRGHAGRGAAKGARARVAGAAARLAAAAARCCPTILQPEDGKPKIEDLNPETLKTPAVPPSVKVTALVDS